MAFSRGISNLFRLNAVAYIGSLHRYLADVVHVDIWWHIGNRMDMAPAELPRLSEPMKGASAVPWRYQLNTGMFLSLQ